MTVALSDPLEVSVDHGEAQVDRFGPAAVHEQHRLALPGTSGETPGVSGPPHHTRAKHHQVEGVDECGHHCGREIDRRGRHHGEPFEGDAVITSSRETEGGEPDQSSPRTDPQGLGHGDEQQ